MGVATLLVVVATPAAADIAIEYGQGRDYGNLAMVTLFNRDSAPGEWVSFDLHFGEILRSKRDRLEAQKLPVPPGSNKTETFPFYGFDMAVGHTSLNPYILILLGASQFDRLTHRLGTPWNFHLGLEFGSHGRNFGWFLRAHHWSNGGDTTKAKRPNPGEEFGTFGVEWRF